MKIILDKDTMKWIKDAMKALHISDTHDNRVLFARECVQSGAASLMLASAMIKELEARLPPKFEGYADKVKPIPVFCDDCQRTVVKGQDGKWRCNCQIYSD